MKMCEFVGGAYIYAECVKTGIGKLVWDSHPIQGTNMGNRDSMKRSGGRQSRKCIFCCKGATNLASTS